MIHNDKKLFTVLGSVVQVENRRRFKVNSPMHLESALRRLPMGKQIAITFSERVPTRSQAQLAYHWVLIGYIADHSGYTSEETHDAVMRMKFGTKSIRLGSRTVEVRRSVADIARMPKLDMVDLITYDLELCTELNIRVPTAEDLGYITNYGRTTPIRLERTHA